MYKKVENIDQFNRYFGQPTCNPLVSVANLAEADLSLFEPTDFGMYCVVLMDVDFGELILKNTHLDYRGGTIFTMKPGDVVSMKLSPDVKPKGMMLVFRPELITGTGFGRDFYMFNFFDYEVAEALDLNPDELKVAKNCFSNIDFELHAPDDEFTGHMLRLCISQMLTSCRRFYERQFDTKSVHVSDFIKKLDMILDSYFSSENKNDSRNGLPTVAWCAQQFHLTSGYFGNIVHRETGMTAQQYIQDKVVERAKSLLANDDLSISEIAFALGFEYSNHFTRFFRQKEGITPTAFRKEKI